MQQIQNLKDLDDWIFDAEDGGPSQR